MSGVGLDVQLQAFATFTLCGSMNFRRRQRSQSWSSWSAVPALLAGSSALAPMPTSFVTTHDGTRMREGMFLGGNTCGDMRADRARRYAQNEERVAGRA